MIASRLREVALCFDNMKYGHNETMKSRVKGMRASVVPGGRTYSWSDFPGIVCLANIRCRFATFTGPDRKAGKGGCKVVRKWEKAGRSRPKKPNLPTSSRLFPPFPTFSHLIF